MFLSLKINKKTVIALTVGIIAVILLISFDIMNKASAVSSLSLGETNEQRIEFLQNYGWKTGEQTDSVQVVIPSVFNDVYNQYNDIQITEGFDLSKYKGKAVTRYTYEILNYPDGITGVYANILVFEGKIIGGDICTYALDGFMHGFSCDSSLTGITFGKDALENNA